MKIAGSAFQIVYAIFFNKLKLKDTVQCVAISKQCTETSLFLSLGCIVSEQRIGEAAGLHTNFF